MMQKFNSSKNSFIFTSTPQRHSLFRHTLYGVITALLFSAFIYLEHYGYTIKILNTLFAIASLAMFLYMPKRAVLIAGFFIGVLWFYWIGYSFKYNGVGYLAPFVTLGFAIIYMLFFGVLALTDKVYIRALLILALSYFEPFDWNWLQIELLFVESYIGVAKYQLVLVLIALSLPKYIKRPYTFTPLLLILLALNYNPNVQKEAPLKIKLIQTDIAQDVKWKKESIRPTIYMIFTEVQKATQAGYDIIVFPESVIPLFLNKYPQLVNELLKASKHITIVAGSLLSENNQHFNVTYIFNDGNYKIAKKMVLVPFGEYVPLPKFAQKIISDFFFNGQADFTGADAPTDYTVKDVTFRNAICYEATCQEIYKGDINYVIAISNNAWFAPSIEPTIQKLLMKYYARKNGVTIYHSANYKGTGIVK